MLHFTELMQAEFMLISSVIKPGTSWKKKRGGGGECDLQGNDKQPKSSDTRTAERHQSRHHRMSSLRHAGIHLLLKDNEVKPTETDERTSVTGTAIVGQ